MPTGFVERFKGKIALPVGGLWIGGTQVGVTGPDANSALGQGSIQSLTSTSADTALAKVGGLTVIATTLAAVISIPAPQVGITKYFSIEGTTGDGSTAVVVMRTSTAPGSTTQFIWGGSTVNGASTTTNLMKYTSTAVAWTTIELYGRSTSLWQFIGVQPSTLSHIVFSTSS